MLIALCVFGVAATYASSAGALYQTPVLTAAAPVGPDLANPVPSASTNDQGSGEDKPQAYITYKTPYEFYLTAITVALGILMAVLLSVIGLRQSVHVEILRSFLLVMIVFSALFLIVAGYSEKQTAPVFGLLGTILGYMFGRSVDSDRTQPPPTSPSSVSEEKPKKKQRPSRG